MKPFILVALTFFIISVQCLDNKKMLDLVNAERKKAGAKPLSIDNRLCKVAEDHSKYMASINTLTHDDKAGDMGTRYKQHGYEYSCGGENVAEGYTDDESVMQGWMNSPGHRANILNPSFEHAGFGQSGQDDTKGKKVVPVAPLPNSKSNLQD
ncbi:1675_t:CDS:2, partial [Dentiscutata heterogama]